jgi:predicted ATPase
MASSFETIRIDGTDYRQRALDGHAEVCDDAAYRAAIDGAAASGVVSDDAFAELIRHLATVHPSRYVRLIENLSMIGLRDVITLQDQSAALRFVAFVDRAYDAQIPVRATGRPSTRSSARDARGRLPQEVPARDLAPQRAHAFLIALSGDAARNVMFTWTRRA